MYNIDNINRDFAVMASIIESVLHKPAHGMEELKERYIRAKEHLFPFFDENGMRIEVMQGEGIGSAEFEPILQNAINKVSEGLNANRIEFEYLSYRNLIYGIREFGYNFMEDLIAGKILQEVYIYGNRFAQDARIGKALNAWLIGRMANVAFDSYGKFNSKADLDTITEIGNLACSWIRDGLQTSASKVYISINPLDYLMMSDHCTYTSCHSFLKQGCYHAGTVSYMLDPVTIVGYTANNWDRIGRTYRNMVSCEDTLMPHKNWRQLVHLDLDHKSAIFGREFADHNASYAKYLRKITGHFLQEYSGDIAEKWIMASCGYGATEGTQEEKDDNIESDSYFSHVAGETWEYDDGYRAMITLKSGSSPAINVGSDSIVCPICGSRRDSSDTEQSDTLLCPSCGNRVCDNCGCIISSNHYNIDGQQLCDDCYQEIYTQCNNCDYNIRREDAMEYNYDSYCPDCFNEYFFACPDCGEVTRKRNAYFIDGELYCESCYNERTEDEDEASGS